AARLTPEERARSSSDIPRPLRLCRRFSATRRPRSAAPTSSPGPARGRLGLRAATASSILADARLTKWNLCFDCPLGPRPQRRPRRVRAVASTGSRRYSEVGLMSKQVFLPKFSDTRDIDEFVGKLEAFERGELNPEQFRAFRLLRGVYGQRQMDVQMFRIKI